MKTNFLTCYLRMFYKPFSTFETIFKSDKNLKWGFYALLLPIIGYTLFYIMANFAGGSPSTFKPWLPLSIEKYFMYDIFLTFPGYFLSWIASSAMIYIISRIFLKSIKFDQILAVGGFTIGIATWSSMFHDLTDTFLSIIGVIDMQKYEMLLKQPTFGRGLLLTLYAIYFCWFLLLFTIGIKKATQMNIFKSLIIALLGLVTFQFVLFVFIR